MSDTLRPSPHEAVHDPYSAWRELNFRRFILGNAAGVVGAQMFHVAVGWELYQLTNSATALGLVGLFQVLPILLLTVPAGNIVDRVSRKAVIIIDQIFLCVAAAMLAAASLYSDQLPDVRIFEQVNGLLQRVALFFGDTEPRFVHRHIPVLYALLALNGLIRSFNQPAKHSILPQLVRPEIFGNAVTWNSSVFETCTVLGPAIGGGILAALFSIDPSASYAYAVVYMLTAICHLIPAVSLLPIRLLPLPSTKEPLSLKSFVAGVEFVLRQRVILAAITLDLFAVLLGGATALLPMVAKDILHVGPFGLGMLRAAPSLGAVTMAFTLAHRGPMQHAGRSFLYAVVCFGIATIVFGLSRSFPLSLIALFFTGAADNISVVVRQTLVQVLTPNEMRGRVSAVSTVFIACSNELGALESGLTAAVFGKLLGAASAGAIASIVSGGCGTLLVVFLIRRIFPEVLGIGSLQHLAIESFRKPPLDVEKK